MGLFETRSINDPQNNNNLCAIILSVIMLSVAFFIVMPRVIVLSVVVLSVVMLSVMAPNTLTSDYNIFNAFRKKLDSTGFEPSNLG
jgi:Mn2+/Fe2+ NRAMP family transporter